MYYGVYTPAVEPVVSPNGDGVDETQELSYKVVRPSKVTVTLRAPGGGAVFTETIDRAPGTYAVAFPPVGADPNAEPPTPAEGRWQLDVAATDDVGRASTTRERFTVNNTMGFVKLSRRKITVRPRGKQVQQAGVTLTRAARVRVTVETRSGVRVATIANQRAKKGRFLVRWRGTTRGGRLFAYGGTYVLRFRASNALGVTELTSNAFKLVRAKPVAKKQKKPRS
jgi:hypothetical protein